MIERLLEVQTIRRLLARNAIVGIVGARQVGKTTLARHVMAGLGKPAAYFDLEDPEDLARLYDPMLVLKQAKGLVVIDEVQRLPGLFQVLRVLADRAKNPARFLILGSASPELLRQGSESLAGRVAFHELKGFALDEVGIHNWQRLWLRGGFPRAYLARTAPESYDWRREFVQTFLERDLPQLGITIRSVALRRFWTMLAHYHAQTWNSSEFARAFGVADTTVRNYLDVLTAGLVAFQLQPWHENISKRQVKSPKVYLADSGILHTLLNLPRLQDLEGHPKVGASWEGFVIGQLIRRLGARPEECFFWATHAGSELDLLVVSGNRRLGFEVNRTSSPRLTPSIRNAMKDLRLRSLDVVHSGDKTYPLGKGYRAVAVSRMLDDVAPIR